MDKLLEQLKGLQKVAPRAEWKAMNRERLLAQIEMQIGERESTRSRVLGFVQAYTPYKFFQLMVRPVGVICLALLIIGSSGALTVNAARESLPGDVLYGIKLTTEKIQASLTLDSNKKVELHAAFAEERIKEINSITKNETDPQKKILKIMEASDNLKTDLTNVQNSLDQIKNVSQDKAGTAITVATAQLVNQKVEAMSTELNKQANDLKTNTQISEKLKDVVSTSDATGVKAVEVMVDKYNKDNTAVNPIDVVTTLQQKVQKAEEKINQVTALSQTADKTELTRIDSTKAATTVPEKDDGISADAVKKVLAEAESLIKQGDLTGAISKLRESALLTSDAEAVLEVKLREMLKATTPITPVPTTTTTGSEVK